MEKRGWDITVSLSNAILIAGYTDKYAVKILIKKADNVPIVLMFYLVPGTLWLSMYQAYKNDERLEKGEAPDEYNDPKDKILVWPDLVYTELICLILFTVFLTIWSVYLPAPLEEPANPAATPNPSKAPWYFLGLQEMLVYFDPWIAGIMFPLLIIAGLCAIPYVDTNKKEVKGTIHLKKEESVFLYLCMVG